MTLEHSTAVTLKIGVLAGLALIIIGLCSMYAGLGDGILYAGMVVLVLSPFLGGVASLVCLVSEKDWYWAAVAGLLIVITSAGIISNIL